MNVRKGVESDFTQINALFKEFAEFEKLPEKMTNTVEQMEEEKEFFNCWIVEMPDNRIVGYVSYFFCFCY
jgi:diamine N-acetyltransferase